MARGKQVGCETFSSGGAGHFHDFPSQQAPDQIEDEDDDDYENDAGTSTKPAGDLTPVPPTPLIARTKKPILRVLEVLGLTVSESLTIRPGTRPVRRSDRRAPYFGHRR
jgi:hypothetical protein